MTDPEPAIAVEAAIAAVERALDGASPAPSDTPWLSGLVVCLARQQRRQRWHLEIHQSHLGGDPEGHTIDPWFFARRIESLGPRSVPEARLRTWLPTIALITAAIDDLRTAGVIGHPRSSNHFLLGPRLVALTEGIVGVDLDDDAFARSWDAQLGTAAASAAFERWIVRLLASRARATSILEDLVGLLPRDRAIALITPFADGPIDLATAAAVREPSTSSTPAPPRSPTSCRASLPRPLTPGSRSRSPRTSCAAIRVIPPGATRWSRSARSRSRRASPAIRTSTTSSSRRSARSRWSVAPCARSSADDDDAWFARTAARLGPLAARLRGIRVS